MEDRTGGMVGGVDSVGSDRVGDQTVTGVNSASASGNGARVADQPNERARARGRGRPRKNQPGAQTSISVETPQEITDRAAPAPAPAPVAKKPARAKKAQPAQPAIDGAAAARGLIEMVELFTIARFGPEAAFTDSERFFIEPALGRLVERYGSAVDQFGWLIDPALVAAGVALYAVRLGGLARPGRPAEPGPERGAVEAPEGSPGAASDWTPPPADQTPPIPAVGNEFAALFGSTLRGRT